MANFIIKTKGNADPMGKRKVYFTCHPDDFDRYFVKIREDIFATHDCAIYYTPDMTEEIADEDKSTDLGQMNLFVIPITLKLLTKPNRAMDSDIVYAKRKSIPILPLMMESGIDEFYSKPDKFDKLQYLNPYSNDPSEISYADKLKKYLESVLISDEMAQKIRAAFDTYIFLSYRKKDRRYANELMRLIHNIPEYRNIAIWYDEFLTPGESFRQNIDKAMKNSKLFALLVTPNLLEPVNGKPNFVMEKEYPAAKKAKITIIPTEMVQTDKKELNDKFRGIPNCANPADEAAFRKRFLDALENIAVSKHPSSPVHNFLIGLAYLDGIDVEVDRERALELISLAAESDLEEAIRKLVSIYSNSGDQELDSAIVWQKRIVHLLENNFTRQNETHTEIIDDLLLLSDLYERNNKISQAIEVRHNINSIYEKILSNHSNKSTYLYRYVQNIYKIAKLVSYNDDYESQTMALNYLSKSMALISDSYNCRMEDSALLIIAGMYETIAQYIITKSRRFDKKIGSDILTYDARKMRRTIEKYNNIDLTTWLTENSLYYKYAERSHRIFYRESGLNKLFSNLNMGSPDAGTDFQYTDPLMEAEELLIIATAIYEHLLWKDVKQYGESYIRSFGNVASLWITLGANHKAIATLTKNIQFLQKFESDFYCDKSDNIIEQYELLASAYKNIRDEKNFKRCLNICIKLLESHRSSRKSKMQLISIYRMMSNNTGSSEDCILYLRKAVDLLENLNDENALLDKEIFILMDSYCSLLDKYVTPDFWDSEKFFEYFAKAHELGKKFVHANEIQSAIYFNTLYRVRINLEDCKTVESVRTVGELFNLAFNNCKKLLNADSEHSNHFWFKTISVLIRFDQYAHLKLQGNRLTVWEQICAQLITYSLSFIADIANDTPLSLIEHNYRTPFTDYFLFTGGADNDFIKNYNTLLYVLFELFINLVYRKGFTKEDLDMEAFIKQAYSKAIKCQEQGYAFQIFNKEQAILLKMIAD